MIELWNQVLLYFYVHIGDDYRCNACNLTLVAGMRSVFFNISIFDDNILELDEDFMLTNISTYIPSNSNIRVITGSLENAIVVIEDDDCKLCGCVDLVA